ncbi:hypothetical protein [Amorphus sp. MBR-141]
MHAPFELAEGRARLQRIIDEFPPDSPHWNEAQNRFQFIDRLLTECLGWERPNLTVEETDEAGGRADYVLGHPPKAVLEAKKEARHFGSLPSGKPTVVKNLASLLAVSKILSAAATQVLGYCVIKGAPVAIVCNGPQLVVFQALTPGQYPLEGECYCFDGFADYISHFGILWSILSPEGITENRASRELTQYRNPRIPPKASEFIPEPTKHRYRSQFQENLRELSSLLLEAIEDNEDVKTKFYEECYVSLEANNRHLLLSKSIISSRYRRVSGDGVAPSAFDAVAGTNQVGELTFDGAASEGVAGSRPIVVIGDVGVGKTSFFENLYEQMDQSEKSNTYFIHINLGVKANLSTDVKTYVIYEIPSVLRRQYNVDIDSMDFVKSIYHNEMRTFDDGVKGSLKEVDPKEYQKERVSFLSSLVDRRDNHLHAALGHLRRGRNKQIILVMDNADQRNLNVQQEAFLISQELAATRNVVVFVALRPSTFFSSKTTGALAGYQNKILTISPPPADEVVQRRLAFAVRVAEGKVAPAALSNIRLQLGSVVSFFTATLRSIRTNEAIRQFLSNITGGNTRAVIELITSFVGSPNVDSQKIVRIEEEEGDYRVPLHEFTKHALLGEYAYFNSQSSLVACNIFDISTADPREHFLLSLIISYLSSNIGVRDSDGFFSGAAVLAEMSQQGFLEHQVRHALRRGAEKRLIETPHAHYREIPVSEDELPEQFYFRATSVGVYHVKFWTGAFAFLDATSIDTPIFVESVRDEIAKHAASFEISERHRRATLFKEYLFDQWHLANIGASYYDFGTLLSAQVESFDQVKRFIDRGHSYGRKKRRPARRPHRA